MSYGKDVDDFASSDGLFTNAISKAGEERGKSEASSTYPYAVSRDVGEVRGLGEKYFQLWEASLNKAPHSMYYADSFYKSLNIWKSQIGEVKRLFISAFTGAYLDYIQKEDAKKAPQQPQPVQTTATSPTGATITVINQTHKDDIHTYWVRIADSRHFDEAQDFPLPLVVDFSEAPVSDTGTVTSSGTSAGVQAGGYAMAGGDIITPSYQSKPTQKKKPRMYFGKH